MKSTDCQIKLCFTTLVSSEAQLPAELKTHFIFVESFKRLHFRFVECTVYKLQLINLQLLIFLIENR